MRVRRALLLLAMALGVGCGRAPAPVLDVQPNATPRTCPALPPEVDFGRVPRGGFAVHALSGVPESGATFTLSGAPDFTAAAQALELRPTAAGPVEATLRLSVSGCPEQVAQLVGEGVEPCVDAAAPLQLPATERTCGASRAAAAVTNRCAAPVTVQRAVIDEGADGAGAWCVTGPPCAEWGVVSQPGVVPPGASGEVVVQFVPANDGPAQASLRLTVRQDDGFLELATALESSGLARQMVTELFPPPRQPSGDLLVVLDTSPSMRARAAAVQPELDSFWQYLGFGLEDRLVLVTSAERSTAGAIVGSALGTDADFVTKLSLLAASAPDGTEDTSCLAPLLAVLEAQPSPLRPGVKLDVVCVTDSPDRAPGAWLESMSRLPTSRPLSVRVVGPFSGDCVTEWDDGRLALLANATNGVLDSICVPGWSRTLENLEPVTFGYRTWFYLSRVPQRVVSVEADGVGLEPQGGSGWRWDSILNAIVISPLHSGFQRELAVTYEPACQ